MGSKGGMKLKKKPKTPQLSSAAKIRRDTLRSNLKVFNTALREEGYSPFTSKEMNDILETDSRLRYFSAVMRSVNVRATELRAPSHTAVYTQRIEEERALFEQGHTLKEDRNERIREAKKNIRALNAGLSISQAAKKIVEERLKKRRQLVRDLERIGLNGDKYFYGAFGQFAEHLYRAERMVWDLALEGRYGEAQEVRLKLENGESINAEDYNFSDDADWIHTSITKHPFYAIHNNLIVMYSGKKRVPEAALPKQSIAKLNAAKIGWRGAYETVVKEKVSGKVRKRKVVNPHFRVDDITDYEQGINDPKLAERYSPKMLMAYYANVVKHGQYASTWDAGLHHPAFANADGTPNELGLKYERAKLSLLILPKILQSEFGKFKGSPQELAKLGKTLAFLDSEAYSLIISTVKFAKDPKLVRAGVKQAEALSELPIYLLPALYRKSNEVILERMEEYIKRRGGTPKRVYSGRGLYNAHFVRDARKGKDRISDRRMRFFQETLSASRGEIMRALILAALEGGSYELNVNGWGAVISKNKASARVHDRMKKPTIRKLLADVGSRSLSTAAFRKSVENLIINQVDVRIKQATVRIRGNVDAALAGDTSTTATIVLDPGKKGRDYISKDLSFKLGVEEIAYDFRFHPVFSLLSKKLFGKKPLIKLRDRTLERKLGRKFKSLKELPPGGKIVKKIDLPPYTHQGYSGAATLYTMGENVSKSTTRLPIYVEAAESVTYPLPLTSSEKQKYGLGTYGGAPPGIDTRIGSTATTLLDQARIATDNLPKNPNNIEQGVRDVNTALFNAIDEAYKYAKSQGNTAYMGGSTTEQWLNRNRSSMKQGKGLETPMPAALRNSAFATEASLMPVDDPLTTERVATMSDITVGFQIIEGKLYGEVITGQMKVTKYARYGHPTIDSDGNASVSYYSLPSTGTQTHTLAGLGLKINKIGEKFQFIYTGEGERIYRMMSTQDKDILTKFWNKTFLDWEGGVMTVTGKKLVSFMNLFEEVSARNLNGKWTIEARTNLLKLALPTPMNWAGVILPNEINYKTAWTAEIDRVDGFKGFNIDPRFGHLLDVASKRKGWTWRLYNYFVRNPLKPTGLGASVHFHNIGAGSRLYDLGLGISLSKRAGMESIDISKIGGTSTKNVHLSLHMGGLTEEAYAKKMNTFKIPKKIHSLIIDEYKALIQGTNGDVQKALKANFKAYKKGTINTSIFAIISGIMESEGVSATVLGDIRERMNDAPDLELYVDVHRKKEVVLNWREKKAKKKKK